MCFAKASRRAGGQVFLAQNHLVPPKRYVTSEKNMGSFTILHQGSEIYCNLLRSGDQNIGGSARLASGGSTVHL